MNKKYPAPPFDTPHQSMPGLTERMNPKPDHGEKSYKGSGKLEGRKAIITGGDSGIGRAVAIAFAREGADVLIAYLQEEADALETRSLIEAEGRRVVLMKCDIQRPENCQKIAQRAGDEFGQIDILVNNAAHQASFSELEDITDEEWDMTFRVNIHAMFYLTVSATNGPRLL